MLRPTHRRPNPLAIDSGTPFGSLDRASLRSPSPPRRRQAVECDGSQQCEVVHRLSPRRPGMAGRHDEQASYDGLFARLAEGVRADGWEARQETPPQAYLHVSRPGWGDGGMDGIHIEAYGG